LRRSIVSAARLRALNLVAVEKVRAVENAFSSAKESVLNLPDSQKKNLLSKMLVDKSLIDGRVTVLIDKKYAGLLPKANGVEVKTQKLDDFGFIMTSKDGLVLVDKRLNAVLSEISEKIKPELCSILFGES
jgi:vacuolar-type H+-ATPase subunit E/Vma4